MGFNAQSASKVIMRAIKVSDILAEPRWEVKARQSFDDRLSTKTEDSPRPPAPPIPLPFRRRRNMGFKNLNRFDAIIAKSF